MLAAASIDQFSLRSSRDFGHRLSTNRQPIDVATTKSIPENYRAMLTREFCYSADRFKGWHPEVQLAHARFTLTESLRGRSEHAAGP